MFDRTQTFLPKTAPELSKALDILEERLLQLPVSMISKNPMTVSEALLDHLAWENSVDAWGSGWSIDIKRRVVAVSAELHRFKGSPYAVKLALSAFGVAVDLVEWWEPDGSGVPGTFVVQAFVTDPLDGSEELSVTGSTISAMKSVLNGVSPVSRGWSLQLGVRAFASGYLGVFSQTHITAEAGYLVKLPPPLHVALSQGVLAHTQIQATVKTG